MSKTLIIKSKKKGVEIFCYKISKNEFNNIERLRAKRHSIILESGKIIFTEQILAFGSMIDLYNNWSQKYRDFFINLFEIKEKNIPDCDMGWVNTNYTKSQVYTIGRPEEDVIMRTQKQFPLSLLYNAIERVSPNHVMDWDYILLVAEPNDNV